MKHCWLGLVAFGLLVQSSVAAAAQHEAIRMFVRGASGHDRERLLPLSAVSTTEIEEYDVQYDQRFLFRGVRLRDLISYYGPPATVDSALLHFANGMVIPLPFRDHAAMDRLQPLLAIAIKIGEGKKGWTRHFPALSRENEEYFDLRPTVFEDNKLIVQDRWHPDLPVNAERSFSPWMHADSLVAIEFVSARPYFEQFDVEHTPETHHGFELFQKSCAFCHGARGVGARFGSDLVWPRPLYEQTRPFSRFYYHITFRAPDAAQHGFMMPALSYMSEADAHAVWLWLQAIARRNVLPYQTR